MNLASAAHVSPRIRRAIDDICDELLGRRRSLLVLIPTGIESADVLDLLRSELGRRDTDIRDLTGTADGLPVSQALADALGVVPSAPAPAPGDVLRISDGQGVTYPDVLLLEAAAPITPEVCDIWCDLLAVWSATMRARLKEQRQQLPMCAIIPAALWGDRMPRDREMLDVHWWSGTPSVTEMRLLCRSETLDDACGSAWREQVLPPLAAGDIDLLAFLWGSIADGWDQLPEQLRTFAEQRGWSAAELRTCGAEELCLHIASPRLGQPAHDAKLRRLWAQGAIQWTPEHGGELHIAALALLGRPELVSHRIWRAQVSHIMPLVNSLRLAACDHLASVYGAQWPEKVAAPDSDKEYAALRKDPTSCEFGHLRNVLSTRSGPGRWDRWTNLIDMAAAVRNDIAHYKPISYATFEDLWRRRTLVHS